MLLAPDFKEVEAIVITDILCRLQIKAETVACAEPRAVMSYHGILMMTDSTLAARQTDSYDAAVLPGGSQGSVNLAVGEAVIQFIVHHDETGKLTHPVCSAVVRALGGNGLLKGRRYACSGDLRQNIADGEYIDASAVKNSNFISGKGLGHTFDSASTLSVRLLEDSIPVRDHADHTYYRW